MYSGIRETIARAAAAGSPAQRQLIKFLFVGALNTAVGYGSYFILLYFLNYLVALVLSHFIGVTHSYLWNKYWTFKTTGDRLREFLRFNAVYLLVLAANVLLLGLLVDVLGFDPRIGQLFVLPVVTLISFFGHKFWSFGSK